MQQCKVAPTSIDNLPEKQNYPFHSSEYLNATKSILRLSNYCFKITSNLDAVIQILLHLHKPNSPIFMSRFASQVLITVCDSFAYPGKKNSFHKLKNSFKILGRHDPTKIFDSISFIISYLHFTQLIDLISQPSKDTFESYSRFMCRPRLPSSRIYI